LKCEGAAKLRAYREAGDGTERVGMCFLVREALLSMLGAVAEARAARAEVY